jgi:hypothetical protein
MTLILTTPSNPGSSEWTDATALGVGAYINGASETQTCTAATLTFSQVGVTIPANTLQNGMALSIGCRWGVDTTALPNPDSTTFKFGFAIQGTNTQTGISVAATCDPYVIYAGSYCNGSAVISAGNLTISGLTFMQQTATVNGFASLLSATIPLDFTQACTIVPVIVITSVPDPLVTVTAGGLTAQILRS